MVSGRQRREQQRQQQEPSQQQEREQEQEQEQQGLQARFVALRERHARVVVAIVAAGRLDDPEAVVAEVWARAWVAYPRMVLAERSGREHRWEAWIAQIARRLVIDEQRRQQTVRRYAGRRVSGLEEVWPDDGPDGPDGLELEAAAVEVGWGGVGSGGVGGGAPHAIERPLALERDSLSPSRQDHEGLSDLLSTLARRGLAAEELRVLAEYALGATRRELGAELVAALAHARVVLAGGGAGAGPGAGPGR